MKSYSVFLEREAFFPKKCSKLERGRGERIESRETSSGLKMDAGNTPDAGGLTGRTFPRRQGRDDGSMHTNSLK